MIAVNALLACYVERSLLLVIQPRTEIAHFCYIYKGSFEIRDGELFSEQRGTAFLI